jgi:Domain of unknown function (DUF1934).
MIDKRKIILTVKQIDNGSGSENIVYDGEGELIRLSDGLRIHYYEDGKHEVCFMVRDEHISLRRKADVLTEINFKIMDLGKMTVASPFGVVEMKSFTHNLELSDETITIHYDVVEAHDVVASYRSEWIWEEIE